MSKMSRFENIGFEDFRELAEDNSLSKFERIGFPNSYREGYEHAIYIDIKSKLTNLNSKGINVLDIGPGCSDLPFMLIENCITLDQTLHLIDSPEMLGHLPEGKQIYKLGAMYPSCPEFIESHTGKFDAIICYSVLHYIFVDVSFFKFIDSSLSLLASGGQFLIGDIPNISKRKRFFSSETGINFHKDFMKTNESPFVDYNKVELNQIDDSVIFAILQRARLAGFDAFVLPQNPNLPMANRREDILIIKP